MDSPEEFGPPNARVGAQVAATWQSWACGMSIDTKCSRLCLRRDGFTPESLQVSHHRRFAVALVFGSLRQSAANCGWEGSAGMDHPFADRGRGRHRRRRLNAAAKLRSCTWVCICCSSRAPPLWPAPDAFCMVMQRRNERTRHFPTMAGAAFEQHRECTFDPREVLQPLAYIGQMPGCQLGGCAAPHPVVELQQLPNFFEAEPQPLRRLDEPQPGDVGSPIAANASHGPLRFLQQSLALVETDRFDVHTGFRRHPSNRQEVFVDPHVG